MTTIRNQLIKLKPAHRDAALTNMKPSGMTKEASDIGSAIALAFDWVDTPEGYVFWSDICHDLIRGEYHFTEEDSKQRALPTDSAERKTYPIFLGLRAVLSQRHRCRVSLELQGQPAASP